MNRKTGIGIKDKYLMLNFKIVLLEASEVETDPPMTDRRKTIQKEGHKIVGIDGYNVFIYVSGVIPLKQKKNF